MNQDKIIKDTELNSDNQQESSKEEVQKFDKPISILESNLSSNKQNLSDKNRKGIIDFNIDYALGQTAPQLKSNLSGEIFKIDSQFQEKLVKINQIKPAQIFCKKRNFQNISNRIPINEDIGIFTLPDSQSAPPLLKKQKISINISKSINNFIKSLQHVEENKYEFVSLVDPFIQIKNIDGLAQQKSIFNNIKEMEKNQNYVQEQIQGEMSSWLDSPDVLKEFNFLTKKKYPMANQQLFNTHQQELQNHKQSFDGQSSYDELNPKQDLYQQVSNISNCQGN